MSEVNCTLTMAMASKFALFLVLLILQICAVFCREVDDENNPIAIPLYPRNTFKFAFEEEEEHVQKMVKVVEASRARARALKAGLFTCKSQIDKEKEKEEEENSSPSSEESLYARSFGGYSFTMRLGSPAQELSVILDTGSDLVWVPCTANYTCFNCPSTNATTGAIYLPAHSSSSKLITCDNPYCKHLFGDNTENLCFGTGKCSGTLGNCSQVVCPSYVVQYGKGSVAGLLLSETLTLSGSEVKDFGFGCSVVSSGIPLGTGIAGFGRGRGRLSLPSQLGDRFGYCLQSHSLDEQQTSSTLLLGNDAILKATPLHLHYTPFIKNPSVSPYDVYYYIGLRGVSVGGKRLELPSNLSRFDNKGNGGTIIDSGTTFTVVHEKIFEQIAGAFASQIEYSRARELENRTGFGLCYNLSGLVEISLPEFSLHFKGGADMEQPLANYFVGVEEDSICLALLSSRGNTDSGPAVLLGNYNQQNFYILYDTLRNRLGFAPKTCATST